MRDVVPSGKYKDDLKRLFKQKMNLDELDAVIDLLAEDAFIPPKYNDHALKGDKKGYRDVHLRPDWILIYYKEGCDLLHLIRTGSHSEIFRT